MRILTLERLEKEEACEEQREKFEEVWGKQVEVTPDVFVQHAATFEWDWACYNLLSKAKHEQWLEDREEMLKGYREKRQALHDTRDNAVAEIDGPQWGEAYLNKEREIFRDHQDKITELQQERSVWEARKFAELYIADEGSETSAATSEASGKDDDEDEPDTIEENEEDEPNESDEEDEEESKADSPNG